MSHAPEGRAPPGLQNVHRLGGDLAIDEESTDIRWVHPDELTELPMHPSASSTTSTPAATLITTGHPVDPQQISLVESDGSKEPELIG